MSQHAEPPIVLAVTDLASRQGEVLGHSSWRTVTQDDVTTFAKLSGDEQWIHVDPDRAADGPFGTTIVHGYLSLSFATLFLDEVVTVSGANLVLNYGSDRIRYPTPTPVGSRIRAAVELATVTPIAGGVQTIFRLTYEVEGLAKPGCVADIVYRYYTDFPA